MSEQKLTVLSFDTDVYCDPDTGVCTVPAARPQASPDAADDPAAAAKSQGRSSVAVAPTSSAPPREPR